MRLMIERNTDPRHNLAREETLLNQASGETVYLWRNRSSVIIGRHQNTLAEIDEKSSKEPWRYCGQKTHWRRGSFSRPWQYKRFLSV